MPAATAPVAPGQAAGSPRHPNVTPTSPAPVGPPPSVHPRTRVMSSAGGCDGGAVATGAVVGGRVALVGGLVAGDVGAAVLGALVAGGRVTGGAGGRVAGGSAGAVVAAATVVVVASTWVVVGPASVVVVAAGGAARSGVAGVAASVVVGAAGVDAGDGASDDTVDVGRATGDLWADRGRRRQVRRQGDLGALPAQRSRRSPWSSTSPPRRDSRATPGWSNHQRTDRRRRRPR